MKRPAGQEAPIVITPWRVVRLIKQIVSAASRRTRND
jgi:hypothetical protein